MTRVTYDRYDLVRILGQEHPEPSVIVSHSFRREGEGFVTTYTLHRDGEPERVVDEDQLEKVGSLTPPIPFDAIVEIHPKNPKYAHLAGRRGVVEGNGWNPSTHEWGFAVGLQSGEGWYFMEDELRNTGRFLPPEVIEERWGSQNRFAVSPLTGEAVPIDEKSAPPPDYGGYYVPYPVNFDDL